jgi:hypothetical protein
MRAQTCTDGESGSNGYSYARLFRTESAQQVTEYENQCSNSGL